jgi:Arc/MetJ-type ribon-helix-helix transcriptional regulator
MPNGRAISVRLDDEAVSALRVLENSGLSRSDAIRHALVSTARRASEREALRREVEAVAANEEDRREMALILEHMEELSEPW